MESTINFREKLNNSNDMLQKISLLKGEVTQINELTRKNNTFFNAFDEYIELINAYGVIKQFKNFNFSENDLGDIKEITKRIKNTFETKQVNNPIMLQNLIKKEKTNLQNAWFNFINNETFETLEQLEIFSLVCNNKKEINDMIKSIKGIKEWPLNEEKYKNYINNIDLANEKIKEIHFDKEIEEFLKKIKNKTASLIDLNDKILEWIKENQLKGNIMLSIKTYY